MLPGGMPHSSLLSCVALEGLAFVCVMCQWCCRPFFLRYLFRERLFVGVNCGGNNFRLPPGIYVPWGVVLWLACLLSHS